MKKKMSVLIIIAFFMISARMYIDATTQQTSYEAIVQTAMMHAVSNEQVGMLYAGAFIETTAPCDDMWCYSTFNGEEVKIQAPHVLPVEKEATQQEETMDMTLETDATLYAEPTTEAKRLATISAQQRLPVISQTANWATVLLFGQVMYMNVEPLVATTKQVNVVQVSEPAFLYTSVNEVEHVGQVAANTSLVVTREEPLHYVVELGKTDVYIRKRAATKQVERHVVEEPNVTAHIVSDDAITLYRADEVMATLEPHFRYPVVAVRDDMFVLAFGQELAYVKRADAHIDKGLPVLVYHHLLPEVLLGAYEGKSSTVTVEAFTAQMDALHAARFTTLSAKETYRYMEGHVTKKEAVVITFDDGLLSTKEYAYPLLKQYGFTALQHIISARKDRYDGVQQFDAQAPLQFLTDEEMAQLQDVFSYEAHTFNLHLLDEQTNVSRVVTASAGELRDDLRQNLEDVPTATTFAYPFGQYTQQTIDVLEQLNMKLAFTTCEGYNVVTDSRYTMKRFTPTQQTTLDDFLQYVNGR